MTSSDRWPNLVIDEDANYLETLAFQKSSPWRVIRGRTVRARIDQMTYTNDGEDFQYSKVSQDPETQVITGVADVAPSVDAHHTATWRTISQEEVEELRSTETAARTKLWRTAASVGLIWNE